MSARTKWATAATALYGLVTHDTAEDTIGESIDTSHAVYVTTGDGDGVVIEGDLESLAGLVDQLAAHVRAAARAAGTPDAVRAMAEVLGDPEVAEQIAPALTCREAETTARGIRATGDPDAAASFLAAHIAGDTDDGDTHDVDGTGQQVLP